MLAQLENKAISENVLSGSVNVCFLSFYFDSQGSPGRFGSRTFFSSSLFMRPCPLVSP